MGKTTVECQRVLVCVCFKGIRTNSYRCMAHGPNMNERANI